MKMLQNENFKYQERYLANRMTEAGQQPNRQTKKITDTETGKHLKKHNYKKTHKQTCSRQTQTEVNKK